MQPNILYNEGGLTFFRAWWCVSRSHNYNLHKDLVDLELTKLRK